MTTATARRPVTISAGSRRNLVLLAGASTLVISGLVMLIAGIVIGYTASSRIAKETRGIT